MDLPYVAVRFDPGLRVGVFFEPGLLLGPWERELAGPQREPLAHDKPGRWQERHQLLGVAFLPAEVLLFEDDLREVAGLALVAGDVEEVGHVEGPVCADDA